MNHNHPTELTVVVIGSWAVGYFAGKAIAIVWAHGPSEADMRQRFAHGVADLAHLSRRAA